MQAIWLNNKLLNPAEARIDPTDRGLTLGDGLFETILWQHGTPAHAARHFARLREGAALLAIPVPFTNSTLLQALHDVAHPYQQAALRLTLTRGPAPRGVLPAAELQPTVLITAGPLPPTPPAARVMVARSTRRNEHSPLSRIKSLNYLDSILARQEAAANGLDDALLLNTQGRLAEATAANIVLYFDGRLVTPPVAEGALPGIARAVLLESGEVQERPISAAELRRAEGGFLCNSLGRRPLAEIEGRALRRI
jgi:branched-chain amino acid aminotransferase